MKLKTLATILLGILSILTIGLSSALIVMTTLLHEVSTTLLESNRSVSASLGLKNALLTHAKQAELWKSTQNLKHLEAQREARESMKVLFDEIRRYSTSAHEDMLIQSAVSSVNAYLDERARIESPSSYVIGSLEQSFESFDNAAQSLQDLALLNIEQAEGSYTTSTMYDKAANLLGFIVPLLALAIVPFLSIALRKALYNPMRRLAQAMQAFRQGSDIEVVPSGIDELKNISEAFVEMATEIQKQRETRVRYLASAAHDLRNPISAIKMSADITVARHHDAIPAEVLHFLKIIQRQATHLNRMIGDLLDTVRSEGGELEVNKQIQDLRPIVKECCGLFCNYSQDHHIVTSIEDTPVFAHVDASRISQVINNLVSNAIKYSPYGGTVHMTLSKEENEACLAVKDSGIGIAANERDSIFQPFQRTTATKHTIPGVGLGLFTSRKIVLAHGGRIDLISEPASGSTFIVRIPLVSP